jgi:hypothetical protein
MVIAVFKNGAGEEIHFLFFSSVNGVAAGKLLGGSERTEVPQAMEAVFLIFRWASANDCANP